MRYWIGVASYEHVQRGVDGGFAQVCHGRQGPLEKMRKEDWIVYYSPTYHFGGKDPCQLFTAIGKIDAGTPYQVAMSRNFIPWRRDVSFYPSNNAAIRPLLDHMSFIKDKKRWGFPFRRGCFEIPHGDFRLIAEAMGVSDG